MNCPTEHLSSARAFLEQPVERDYEIARALEVRVITEKDGHDDMIGNHGVFVSDDVEKIPEGIFAFLRI